MSEEDTRWGDRLLERARGAAAPHAEDAARNLASIEARLGIGAELDGSLPKAAAGAAPPARKTAGALRKSGLVKAGFFKAGPVKAGLVLAFGLGSGIVGYVIGRAETERAGDPFAATARATATVLPDERAREAGIAETAANAENTANPTSAPALPEAPAPRVGASAAPRRAVHTAALPRPRAARPTPASPPAEGFALSDALELLRRAEAAVRRSDGLEARMWLSDLDRRAPPQLLLEERLVTRALADCLVADVDAARATLRQLEAVNAESIYRARLEGSCVADRMQAHRLLEH